MLLTLAYSPSAHNRNRYGERGSSCQSPLDGVKLLQEESGNLVGIKVCRGAPTISHLLFADDSLILMKPGGNNAASLRRALVDYCAASGQLVSEANSSIYISPCSSVEAKIEVCTSLNILTEAIGDKYLGLPPIVGRDRTDSFQYVVDRVCNILNGWKEKKLSFDGKETLLKAITQALPCCAMSVFKLPKHVCQGITTAMSQYWWGDEDH